MDGLLKKMPNRETTSHNPSSPSANYLSRNANALARKMEEINTELEDIKSQLNHAYQSVQEPSLFIKPTEIESSERLFGSPSRKQRPESVAHPQLNNPDTSRFDAVPTCIRSYIREELAMMEDRVVTLVNEKIETMEMKLLKEINKTRRPGAGLENRIPWQVEVPASKTQAAKDNEPDDDKKTDFLLRELKDTFRRKGGSLNKKGKLNSELAIHKYLNFGIGLGPVDSTVHTRHTVASRMRCKK